MHIRILLYTKSRTKDFTPVRLCSVWVYSERPESPVLNPSASFAQDADNSKLRHKFYCQRS